MFSFFFRGNLITCIRNILQQSKVLWSAALIVSYHANYSGQLPYIPDGRVLILLFLHCKAGKHFTISYKKYLTLKIPDQSVLLTIRIRKKYSSANRLRSYMIKDGPLILSKSDCQYLLYSLGTVWQHPAVAHLVSMALNSMRVLHSGFYDTSFRQQVFSACICSSLWGIMDSPAVLTTRPSLSMLNIKVMC